MRRIVIALVLVVTACGDDAGLSASEQAMVDAIVTDMQADSEPEEEAGQRCFAEGMVADLGLERLEDLGMTADAVGDPETAFLAMSDAEVERMADIGLRCIDYRAGFTAAMMEDGISQSSAECLTARMAESDFFKVSFITSMRGEDFTPAQDAELLDVFVSAIADCFTPEELASFSGG